MAVYRLNQTRHKCINDTVAIKPKLSIYYYLVVLRFRKRGANERTVWPALGVGDINVMYVVWGPNQLDILFPEMANQFTRERCYRKLCFVEELWFALPLLHPLLLRSFPCGNLCNSAQNMTCYFIFGLTRR